jgi:Lon protease-like protein
MPLPLHIFEPRYQVMLKECLEAGHSFGVVAIREGEETGPPALPHEVGTLPRIVKLERLNGGRVNLLVTGASRFKVLKTLHDHPYLSGEVRFLAEDGDEGDRAEKLTEEVSSAFTEYSRLLRALEGKPADSFEPPQEPEILSYLVGASLNVELQLKQQLLVISRADERLDMELPLLRKEVAILREMEAHGARARRAGLN